MVKKQSKKQIEFDRLNAELEQHELDKMISNIRFLNKQKQKLTKEQLYLRKGRRIFIICLIWIIFWSIMLFWVIYTW